MTNLTLELNINFASNLVNVNLFTKMKVYAKITIYGENTREKQKAKTTVDRSGGIHPVWNHHIKFSVNERLACDGRLTLVMRLISRRVLGNKAIGAVTIPLLELLNSITPPINGDGDSEGMKTVTYQVRTSSGKRSGFLTFSYRFIKPDVPATINQSSVDATACPPPSPIEHPPAAPPVKHSFAAESSDDPLPVSYGAVMTEEADEAQNHVKHAQQPPKYQGFGPFGYAPPSPVVYEVGGPSNQQPREIELGTGLGTGLGSVLGAELLSGFMIGDIVSDVANCYDF